MDRSRKGIERWIEVVRRWKDRQKKKEDRKTDRSRKGQKDRRSKKGIQSKGDLYEILEAEMKQLERYDGQKLT